MRAGAKRVRVPAQEVVQALHLRNDLRALINISYDSIRRTFPAIVELRDKHPENEEVQTTYQEYMRDLWEFYVGMIAHFIQIPEKRRPEFRRMLQDTLMYENTVEFDETNTVGYNRALMTDITDAIDKLGEFLYDPLRRAAFKAKILAEFEAAADVTAPRPDTSRAKAAARDLP
jgi:hypothetical protein